MSSGMCAGAARVCFGLHHTAAGQLQQSCKHCAVVQPTSYALCGVGMAWASLPLRPAACLCKCCCCGKQLLQMATASLVQVLALVDLTPLRDSLVGLPGISGLSVEQRKRLTIAVELVSACACSMSTAKHVQSWVVGHLECFTVAVELVSCMQCGNATVG